MAFQAWNAGPDSSCTVALCSGKHAKEGTAEDNYIYVAMNMYWEAHWFETPGPPEGNGMSFVNTGYPPEDTWVPGSEPALENQYDCSWAIALSRSQSASSLKV